jgi:hypothetical protein
MSSKKVRLVGLALLLVSMLAVLQSCLTTRAQQEFVQCQAEYNEVNNARTRALTESAQRERAAERRVQQAEAGLWLNPHLLDERPAGAGPHPEVLAAFTELQAALTNWRQVAAEADASRAKHPVPPPPSSRCGEPDDS